MDMNSEDIRMENIRLNEAVIRLERENEYLRMLIDKLMPQHVNAEIEVLFNRVDELTKKVRKGSEDKQ